MQYPFFFAQMEIIEKVKELALNLLKEKEIELVDIIYRRQGPDMILKLIADKKDGITIDECGWINERLGELLDKESVLTDRYILEVSSPGLDRILKTKKDFEWAKGRLVRINTYGPVEDKREHIGKVVSCDEEGVTIELKDINKTRKIPLEKISKARLEMSFRMENR